MIFLDAGRRMMKLVTPILGVLATAAALGVVSCSGSDSTRPVFDRAALADGDGSVGELRERWNQWRRLGPTSYDYELHRSCFCGGDYVTPARVEVRDGRVVFARAVDGGRLLRLDMFEPIDSLFAKAIRMSESGERVVVSYDPSLGYPALLTLGTPENDAGVVMAVPSLVAR